MTRLIKRLLTAVQQPQLTREQWFECARQRMIALSFDHTIVGRIGQEVIDMLEHARRAGWLPHETVDVLAMCYVAQSNEMLQHYCVERWGMAPELLEAGQIH